jgi:predicted  nucleic acid-binding Zn-ribbon protein
MDYVQLKKIENNINVLQAKLGLLRAELKKLQNQLDYQGVNDDIMALSAEIDMMQSKYINGKEALNG